MITNLMIWIRCWRKLSERCGKPKLVVQGNREYLVEEPIHQVFNSHLWKSFFVHSRECWKLRIKIRPVTLRKWQSQAVVRRS